MYVLPLIRYFCFACLTLLQQLAPHPNFLVSIESNLALNTFFSALVNFRGNLGMLELLVKFSKSLDHDHVCQLEAQSFENTLQSILVFPFFQWKAAWTADQGHHPNSRKFIFFEFVSVFVDIPCLVMAMFVFLTVFRAKALLKVLWDDNVSVAHKRIECVLQSLFFLRDTLFLVPFLMMICSLFRAPILILEMMTKLNKPRIGDDEVIHFKLYKCTMELPSKGKPMFHIKATKESGFTVNGKCKVFVLGDALWSSVGRTFGASMATAAQSALPNKLWDEHGMNYEDISDGAEHVETTLTLQTPLIDRSSISYNTSKMMMGDAEDTRFVMQFESESGILFLSFLTISDLHRCAESDSGVYVLPLLSFL